MWDHLSSSLQKLAFQVCFFFFFFCSTLVSFSTSKSVVRLNEKAQREWSWGLEEEDHFSANGVLRPSVDVPLATDDEALSSFDDHQIVVLFNESCLNHNEYHQQMTRESVIEKLKSLVGKCLSPIRYTSMNELKKSTKMKMEWSMLLLHFNIEDERCLAERTSGEKGQSIPLDEWCLTTISSNPLYSLHTTLESKDSEHKQSMQEHNDWLLSQLGFNYTERSLQENIAPQTSVISKRFGVTGGVFDERVKCEVQHTDEHSPYLPAWFKDILDGVRDGQFNGFRLADSNDGDVDIYLLDTGVKCDHRELLGNECINLNDELIESSDDSSDDEYYSSMEHGTFTASLMIGQYYGTSHGVFPLFYFNVCRVKKAQSSYMQCRFTDIIQGLILVNQKILSRNAQFGRIRRSVINLSFGAKMPSFLDESDTNGLMSLYRWMESLIQQIESNGGIIVSSAGNLNMDACQTSPNFSPLVITVGSFNEDYQKSYSSNYGRCVEVYAPGQHVSGASDYHRHAYTVKSGSSAAAPITAGLIAWFLQINPLLSRWDITHQLFRPDLSHLLGFRMVRRCTIKNGEESSPICLAPFFPCLEQQSESDSNKGMIRLDIISALRRVGSKLPHSAAPTQQPSPLTNSPTVIPSVFPSVNPTPYPSDTADDPFDDHCCRGSRSFCRYFSYEVCMSYHSAGGFCEWNPDCEEK